MRRRKFLRFVDGFGAEFAGTRVTLGSDSGTEKQSDLIGGEFGNRLEFELLLAERTPCGCADLIGADLRDAAKIEDRNPRHFADERKLGAGK